MLSSKITEMSDAVTFCRVGGKVHVLDLKHLLFAVASHVSLPTLVCALSVTSIASVNVLIGNEVAI